MLTINGTDLPSVRMSVCAEAIYTKAGMHKDHSATIDCAGIQGSESEEIREKTQNMFNTTPSHRSASASY